MTTELEKQFFDTFGIEHEERYYNCKDNLEGKCGIKCPCECCDKSEEVYCYPQITDRQYLELICVSNKELIRRFDISGSDLESIKKNILSQCMKNYTFYSNTLCETYNRLGENFKHQVQAIFKGER